MTPTLIAAVCLFLSPCAETKAPLGAQLTDLVLPEVVSGKTWRLADKARGAKATVIAFIDSSCPVCQNHLAGLNKLKLEFEEKGLQLVGINSHPADTLEEAAQHALRAKLKFPVLRDEGGAWARKLAVDRLPCVLVLDQGFVVRYRGRIDDQFAPGVARSKPTTRDLLDAVTAVLDNRQVARSWTDTMGCLLTFPAQRPGPVAANAPTWNGEVASIVQRACQDCHRPGEAAPFSLLAHDDAAAWADMIREVINAGRMPPWHADAPTGHFANERILNSKDKATLLSWLDAGCPKGTGSEPKPRSFVEGWRIGQPDKIIKMGKPVNVPAQFLLGLAGMPYQYVPADTVMDEDRWVSEIEVRPQSRAQIHHIIVYIIPEGKKFPDFLRGNSDGIGGGMLSAYVPGDLPVIYPEGQAKKLPKGAKLLFEVHYTPNGTPVTDCSSVGLKFAKGPVKHEVRTRAVMNRRFAIPAGDSNHEVKSSKVFEKGAVIITMSPHMHLRGKDFAFDLTVPGQPTVPLLRVPHYDFNWQETYTLVKPLQVPPGSRIDCLAHFDNSSGNPANPDATKEVRWGDMTWQEMMIGFMDYYVP